MAARTNATGPHAIGRGATSTQAGILRPEEFATYTELVRTPAGEALAPWVEYHWTLAWDLPDGTSFTGSTLPHPACNVTVELGSGRPEAGGEPVVVTGVVTQRFDVVTAGRGWVHGAKFRPGGLAALADVDASTLADRTTSAAEVLPAPVVADLATLSPGLDPAEAAVRTEAALAPLVPDEPDPSYEAVLRLVEDMLGDRTLLQVAQVVERHGVPRRRLERLFARYVGASPKWVLARYRMHDVVTALDAGYDGSLADLAAELGWYDQAHFTRDFTRLVGVRPSDYRS